MEKNKKSNHYIFGIRIHTFWIFNSIIFIYFIPILLSNVIIELHMEIYTTKVNTVPSIRWLPVRDYRMQKGLQWRYILPYMFCHVPAHYIGQHDRIVTTASHQLFTQITILLEPDISILGFHLSKNFLVWISYANSIYLLVQKLN